MSGSASSAPTGTQAIERAALLVSTVVKADEPLSFADVIEECGLPKSTTSRLLTSLERTELLERNADGFYVAGPMFWLYATRHDPWDELVRLSGATMDEIGAATRETVSLSVPRGDRVVQVAQVDSTYKLSARDWNEIDVPAHCSAAGRVLLAYDVLELPEELEALTPVTLTDHGSLRSELARSRRRGWVVCADELEIGLSGVAVAVCGGNGQVVAALGVSGPTSRMQEQLDAFGALLAHHAQRLSGQLRRRTRNEKEGVA